MKNLKKDLVKKVIGICGSPRKGNSWWMLQKAKDGIVKNGGMVEIIHLNDYQITWCDGCLTCEDTGTCRIKDDMELIIKKLLASRGIIISTPVYFNSIPGKLKCFIDRLNPLLIDERLGGKKLAVFIVGQLTGKDGKESRNDVKRFFSTLADICNMNLVGIVDAEGRSSTDLEGNKKVAYLCESLGKKIVTNER
jgi:multimeric flavodoxin WrbA